MKSTFFRSFFGVLLALMISPLANAADVVVISNFGITISFTEVNDIFLGEKQFAGSIRLKPVDNAALQKAFLTKFLDMDGDKYNSIWTKKAFRDGLNPPPVKSDDSEVIDFVKKTPGAVGYISTKAAGVNVVR